MRLIHDPIRRRLFRDIDRVADALDGLDDEQIAWKPLGTGSSLIVLITHVVGSAHNTVVQLVGEESPRDRDSEFLAPWAARSVKGEVEAAKAPHLGGAGSPRREDPRRRTCPAARE